MRFSLPLRSAFGAFVLALVLAACDTQAPQTLAPPPEAHVSSDTAYARLLADLGGQDGLLRLLHGSTDAELERTLAAYGMQLEVIDRDAIDEARLDADKDITSCPQFFPTADRTKWFRLVGAGGDEHHYIDSRGRPLIATKVLGPVVTAPRQTTCQTTVGNWGVPAADYDGGHLIGSQLGGWGGRANLAPQHFNFNRGNWARIENKLATCGRLGSGAVQFVVDIDYPSSTALVPSRWRGDVTIGGATRRASFLNQSGGGPDGKAQADGMIAWLDSRGCY